MTTPAVRGGFHADGSWNPDGGWSTPLDRFVVALVEKRRSTRSAPAQFAELIRGGFEGEGEFAAAFGAATLARWAELTTFEEWPAAAAETSAAEHVKRCGRRLAPNQGRWVLGWYIHAEDWNAAWNRLRGLGQETLSLGGTA